MAHNMGQAAVVMIVMMIVMGGFSLAALSRAVPAWRDRIRHAIRRPASPPARTSAEGTR